MRPPFAFSDRPLCLAIAFSVPHESKKRYNLRTVKTSQLFDISVHNFFCQNIPDPINSSFDALPGRYQFHPSQCYLDGHDCTSVYNNIEKVQSLIKKYSSDSQKPSEYVVSINCVQPSSCPQNSRWSPAAWIPWKKQVIFDLYSLHNQQHSVAILPDVVAHEFCHVLIHYNFGQSLNESGKSLSDKQSRSLEESLCDIFAIIVSNFDKPINDWDWKIGKDIFGGGRVIRDPSSPLNLDQQGRNQLDHPLHINYHLDWQQYHKNSNIYSRAVYLWLSAQDKHKKYLFDIDFTARLFFATLERLANGSGLVYNFYHSATIMYEVAEKLLEEERGKRQKLETIREAFKDVGIDLTPSSSFVTNKWDIRYWVQRFLPSVRF